MYLKVTMDPNGNPSSVDKGLEIGLLLSCMQDVVGLLEDMQDMPVRVFLWVGIRDSGDNKQLVTAPPFGSMHRRTQFSSIKIQDSKCVKNKRIPCALFVV